MMWFSVGIGVVHLTCANLIAAWRLRHAPNALGALG
jgi:hypothetical protein